ncbi:OppA family ABC transporter substrate-binding lipoprotein [Metamycoplasma buccale]|uniref:OppA family ABC transporter substrate-binding lipoprotein n=1 Tax=Metamycoplasma buccale TaxID=55602 RepID=UPI00398ED17B
MKNTQKAKYLLYALGPLAVLAPTLTIAAGCVPTPAYQKSQFVYEYNSVSPQRGFEDDGTVSYGSFQNTLSHHHTGGLLVRQQGLTETQIGVTNDGKQVVAKPTFYKYRLELLKKVVLKMKDGTTKVYDNDEVDSYPEGDQVTSGFEGKTYSSSKVRATSNNPKSINNNQFLQDLKNAKTMQFVLKNDVYWTDHQGKKTKYKVQARDFYYSWLRTKALTTEVRRSEEFGGSEKLDNLAKGLQESSSLYYGTGVNYSNDYLYSLFGIDSSKFSKESSFIQKINNVNGIENGTDALTFESLSDREPDFEKFWNKSLIDNYDLVAAPSEYIDELNEKGQQNILNYTGSTPSNLSEIKSEITAMDKTKLAYRAGIYWYGNATQNTLFSGAYYAKPRNGTIKELAKNPNYWDESFVKDETNIKSIIYKFQQQELSKSVYQNRVWNSYKQGTVSSLGFESLNSAQQQEANSNHKKYGLRYTKQVNKDKSQYYMVTTPFVNQLNESIYEFSDAYGKLMWGGTRKELSEGKGNPETYVSGLGLSFRSILNAAVNWNEFMNVYSNNTAKAWLAKVAPGSDIGGKDQLTNNKTPNDYEDQVNSLSAIDVDGNKIDFGGSLGKELSPSENDKHTESIANKADRIKSAGFDKLKEAMKKLIEKFDKDNPSLAGQKFTVKYFFPFINAPESVLEAGKRLSALAKELSDRIDLEMFYEPNGDSPRYNNAKFNGSTGAQIASWSYDFNSSASGYDGLSWLGHLIPTLTMIADKKPETIKKNFPKLFELAEYLIEYESKPSHKANLSLPFKDLHKMAAKLYRDVAKAATKKLKEISGKYELELKDGKSVPDPAATTDLYEWSATFWKNFVESQKNEDLVKLMADITSFMNVDFTYNYTKKLSPYTKTLTNSHYFAPTMSDTVDFYADWKINK